MNRHHAEDYTDLVSRMIVLKTHFYPLLSACFIAIFVITAALSVWNKSATLDEPYHLTAGVSQLQTGDARFNSDHPPLARLLAAIPSLFIKVESVANNAPDAWKTVDLLQAAYSFYYNIEDRLLRTSRLMMLPFAVLLGWLLYAWGVHLFGHKRAWLPLALCAFCPPLLANAPLVTTDMAATTLIFASFYTWWRYIQEPSLTRLGWTCLSVAAASTAKFTAALLVPLFLLLSVIALTSNRVLPFDFIRRLQIVGGGLMMIGIVTVLGIDLIYLFDGVFLTPPEYLQRAQYLILPFKTSAEQFSHFWPSWLPVPLPFWYVIGFSSVLISVKEHIFWTYFLGQTGYGGWPNYFLVMLFVKLPIPTLILIGLGLSRVFSGLPKNCWNVLFLTLPPLMLIWVASRGNMQIGVRHILPAFPFLLLLTGYSLPSRLNRWGAIFVISMAALSAAGSLRVYPYYLMYFNFLGGGPEQGWKISINGDDYSQGDSDLLRWLQERKVKKLAFGEWGFGGRLLLNRAGIQTDNLPCEDTGELVATHAARILMMAFTLDQARCYTWMRLREPDEKIGYSIFIYNSKNLRPPPPANLTLFTQAFELQRKGKLLEAITLYQNYLKQEPDFYQAHFNLAAALQDTNQCLAAIPEYEKTLELWAGYKEAHLNLATCYRQLGFIERAQWHEEHYKQK